MKSLAEELWQCRKEGGVVDIAKAHRLTSEKEALEMQKEVIRLSGMPVLGFKVGSTSLEAQKILGTTEPGTSPILSDYIFGSPATINIDPGHAPAVEGEFAVRLGCDLPARKETYSFDDVYNAVDAVAGAIEVVGSRFKGGLAGKGRFLTTADFGANIALILGSWVENWKVEDLGSHCVRMSINGVSREEGIGARALGHPLNVLEWLANKQAQTKQGLSKGEIISTGTCTGVLNILPSDVVSADFGSFGNVDIKFFQL